MSQQQPRFPDPRLSNFPHTPTSQFPPSQGGYHWICEFCNSVMGTREQTERHQFHCPARASAQQPDPFHPHPTATHGFQGGYSQQPLPPRPSHPYPTGIRSHRPQQYDPTLSPAANVQHQVPDTILRHSPTSHPLASTAPAAAVDMGRYGKRHTVLIWVKETSTLEREVSYIDNVDGGMVLRWSQEFECFRCEVELSLGQHSGVLSLGIRDSILPIRPFIVEPGGPSPQNILITFEQDPKRELPPQRRNVTQSDFLRTGASGTPRERNSHDRIQELETMLSKLNVSLEARNSELAKQNEMENRIRQVLCKTEEDNKSLSREVDELKRDNSFLRESLKEGEKDAKRAGQEAGPQVEGDDLELQVQECQSERERLYSENEKLKKEKRIANDYSDRLRGQKQSLEVELTEVRASLDSTQREKEELRHKLQLLSKEEAVAPPPVPIRSKPLSKDVQVPKHPPEGEKYSLELGSDDSGLKRVSYEGKELKLRPLANLVEAEQHKGHRVVCECEGASQNPRYLEGVLVCLFEDGNTRIAGVKFSTKVQGTSNGVYKGKEWFDSPEGMGGFFPDECVYIST